MALGARNAVGVEVVFVVRFARTGYRREILAKVQAVLTVGFTFVILSGELQLLMSVDIQRTGAHDIQTV